MTEPMACPACGIFLNEPYVRCVKCCNPSRSFCLQCFAKGKEYGNHKNNHPYSIVRTNFTLLDVEWMASEELKLLNAIEERGIGNWCDIAKDVGSKSKAECEDHYFKHYIYNATPPLPEIHFPKVLSETHPTPVSCTTFSQDPPRPIIGSALYQEMAGYMPARGDFSTEYDDYAELDIKDLEFDDEDDPLWNDMQKNVLSIYQSRLKERARRKCIIMTYGLISMKRNLEDCKRYSIVGKSIKDKMRAFMRLLSPDDYYKFMEGILWEEKTKQKIKMLQDCRKAGITRLHSVGTYMRLKRRRDERQRSRTALDDVLAQIKDEASCQQFIRRQFLKESSQGLTEVAPFSGRRPAPPLNVNGMPSAEKLTSKEKELCGNLRLLPTSYLLYKSTLVNEYRKLGSLRLANARNVIKIDVNKTRKIYDLLLEEGLISKGS